MLLKRRSVAYINSLILLFLGCSLLLPAAIDFAYGNQDSMQAFLLSSVLVLLGALALRLYKGTRPLPIHRREMFMITLTSWLLICAVSSLPLLFADISVSPIDALFEATSGVTSTGSTVLVGLQNLPEGILLWRSMMQWYGGIGFLLVLFALVPSLGKEQLQIVNAECTGISEYVGQEKRFVKMTVVIYLTLTITCFGLLLLVGLDLFNAVAHALTTVATGGFSTHDLSVGAFDNLGMELIMILYMIICSYPYILLLLALKNRNRPLLTNHQVRFFTACCFLAWASIFIWLAAYSQLPVVEALRSSLFTVTSIATGSGFTSADYTTWGSFPVAIIFFIPLVGGCVDSSACGIKAFRFISNWRSWRQQLRNLFFHEHYRTDAGERLKQGELVFSVNTFLFLYFLIFTTSSVLLAFLGVDLVTSCSAVMSTLTNLGPGIGPIIGPAGNFAALSSPVKFILMSLMLVGRFEIIALLVIFRRRFWQ